MVACTPALQAEPPLPIPTLTATTRSVMTCATVEGAWGEQWEVAIEALIELEQAGVICGAEPPASKLYAAYFNLASTLEANGDVQAAVAQYTKAYELDPGRQEALDALARLGHLPAPTPVVCDDPTPPFDPAPTDVPDLTEFVTVTGTSFAVDSMPYLIRGVNYYPRHAPWDRFLEEADPDAMAEELDLIQGAGFNTIRVFLRYDALFTCGPELAIPKVEGFAIVDTLLELAQERDVRVMMTLNDLPDLRFRPLYTDWTRYDAQTTYIVRRYRNNPTIIAWDLRNEGDLDYGVRAGDTPKFSQEQVITWLAHTSALVRENAPNHLITAGWWGDPAVTAPHVDFLSFHHWSNAEELAARIEHYQAVNEKPLLLQEVGYHSWADAPADARTEEAQAELLTAVVEVANTTELAGWMIWSAFDYMPEPGQPPNYEHFFGVWRVDGSAKPFIETLQTNP
jgi:tetratricopeptide (TPR) repeat protein